MLKMDGVKAIHATAEEGTQFVKAAFIARRYSITPTCVRQWAAAGKIPSVRFQGTVRFPLAECVAAIEAGKGGAK